MKLFRPLTAVATSALVMFPWNEFGRKAGDTRVELAARPPTNCAYAASTAGSSALTTTRRAADARAPIPWNTSRIASAHTAVGSDRQKKTRGRKHRPRSPRGSSASSASASASAAS